MLDGDGISRKMLIRCSIRLPSVRSSSQPPRKPDAEAFPTKPPRQPDPQPAIQIAHGKDLRDILSGYRAFTLHSIRQMTLKETGFEIETEMAVEAVRNGQRITVVPVQYLSRPGTVTKLDPFQDGVRIFSTIYRLAKMNNPIFYFGIIGLFISLVGGITGVYVILEWLKDIEHLPLTILTVLLITIGFQIFMFGVISDMLLGFHRETIRQIEQLQNPPRPP